MCCYDTSADALAQKWQLVVGNDNTWCGLRCQVQGEDRSEEELPLVGSPLAATRLVSFPPPMFQGRRLFFFFCGFVLVHIKKDVLESCFCSHVD